jgi:hypothetical protein
MCLGVEHEGVLDHQAQVGMGEPRQPRVGPRRQAGVATQAIEQQPDDLEGILLRRRQRRALARHAEVGRALDQRFSEPGPDRPADDHRLARRLVALQQGQHRQELAVAQVTTRAARRRRRHRSRRAQVRAQGSAARGIAAPRAACPTRPPPR